MQSLTQPIRALSAFLVDQTVVGEADFPDAHARRRLSGQRACGAPSNRQDGAPLIAVMPLRDPRVAEGPLLRRALLCTDRSNVRLVGCSASWVLVMSPSSRLGLE